MTITSSDQSSAPRARRRRPHPPAGRRARRRRGGSRLPAMAAVRLRGAGAERPRRLLRLHRLGRPRPGLLVHRAATTSPTMLARPRRPAGDLAHAADRGRHHGHPERHRAAAGARASTASIKSRNVLRVFLFAPAVITPIVTAYLWRNLLGPDGAVNSLLGAVGLDSWQQNWLGDPELALWSIVRRDRVAVRRLLDGHLPGRAAVGARGRSTRPPRSTAPGRCGGSGRSSGRCSPRRSRST